MSELFWPDRVVGEINEISDRAAMGLPDRYVAPRVSVPPETVQTMRDTSPSRLAEIVEEPNEPLTRRLAAGWILGLVGDPRISVFEPKMAMIQGGTATIGTRPEDVDTLFAMSRRFGVKRNWIEKECPRFQTEIKDFALGCYPVTNAEFLAFLADDGYPEIPSSWPLGAAPPMAMNAPVYTITAEAADAYASWLAKKTGRRFRLPTEFEWEFAAAGPEGNRFPWGNRFDDQAANTMDAGLLMTSPVGAFPLGRTGTGLSDMAGNVEEYVSDRYAPFPGGTLIEDDLYLALGRYRIARGGAFNRFSDLARCQRRHGAYPRSLYAIGFRLAEDI